jgi:2-hydroxy-3-keto-5-methylthiopentenyl-1-phosphate phosphatase
VKILVQSDFDGTITEEDTSFFLLDTFAGKDWRRLLREYKEHRLSVVDLNTRAFGMVKADKDTVLESLNSRTKVRDGFGELVEYCLKRDVRLVIVSNGLDFYIRATLKGLGLEHIEVYAAQANFRAEGIDVRYVGPGFKEAYIKLFLEQGYRIVYVGNGDSDVAPAEYADHVFATGELLAYCREKQLSCRPLGSFLDVVSVLELL